MARIQIETTQNVLLEFELGGVGDRLMASMIDFAIATAYTLFGYITASQVAGPSFLWGDSTSILIHIVFIGPNFFYHWYMEFFLNGQTPGKKIMQLKVIKLDGAAPSFGEYFMRWMMRIADSFLFAGIVLMASNRNEQRFGDLAAGTTVIKIRKRARLEDTVLKLITRQDYEPVFFEVLKFSDKDINLIKETVDYARKTGKLERVVKLSKKVRDLHAEVPHMSPMQTLEVLLYDYNYLAQKTGSK
ncbi:MAG: RDD family protein [Cytophagaceae bacterium]|jgi:uncharacterized RDD family membrane protein YckC|nr:RDD family protein [Cytophagaceae bacterium]